VLTFQIIRTTLGYWIGDEPIQLLRRIITVALLINLFLLGCELFSEFHAGTYHAVSAVYLWKGLHGHDALVPWIWSALFMNLFAVGVLVSPVHRNLVWLNIACVAMIIGIWIEKGMGLIVPGFIPTPLGQVVEYTPSTNETLVCVGIWAFGALMYSWMLHVAIPILRGELHEKKEPDTPTELNPQPAT
jgi:molybdopterin-containing oxidoreductase family membrane subunit